jgi:four helix bundle protein
MCLAREVYTVTQAFPKSEVFGLTSQLRRAAVSVPSNVAEGQGRLSDKHFALFSGHARGSLSELETQIELAHSLCYLDAVAKDALIEECAEIGRMLNGLLKTLREQQV